MKRLCAVNPSVGQLDRLTCSVDGAVIIVWPALWYHPFTIYPFLFCTSRGRDFWVYSHYFQGAHMLNKPNFKYSLYMYRIFMKRRIW